MNIEADHWGLFYSWAIAIERVKVELEPIYPNSRTYQHYPSIILLPQPPIHMHLEHICSVTYDQGNMRIHH